MKKHFSIIVIFLVFFCVSSRVSAVGPVQLQAVTKTAGLGVAVIPRSFPHHNRAELIHAFRMAKDLGDYAVFINQWSQVDLKVLHQIMQWCREAALVPVLGLSPTTLDQGRKELDPPEAVRKKAGNNISFGNPVIREAFKKTVRELARLRPPYLCLATEINFLALQRLPEYLFFASLYKEAYREVKKISPQTKVFVSFQWEEVRLLDNKEPDKINEHSKVIDIFRPELDLVALTTYPAPLFKQPEALPADYYSRVYSHVNREESLLFMEIGWPTRGDGTEKTQKAFIKRLPDLLNGMNVTLLAWSLLHDVSLDAFGVNLNSTGLVSAKGKIKPGFNAFKRLRGSI